jgi:hypothetical protein
LKCSKIQKNLNGYLSGELSEREKEQIKSHLKECPECSQEVTALEDLNKKIDQLDELAPTPEFEARFWRKVEEAEKPKPVRQWFSPLQWTSGMKWGLSTAFVALFILGIYVAREGFQIPSRQKGIDSSHEIAEIEKDIDFYQHYEIIKEIDILVNLDRDESEGEMGKLPENHTL